MGIGETLKHQRELKKISIADVSAATRISKKYLQALEDDHFSMIPSPVFAKGFLKTYAGFLGLEHKGLLEELVSYYMKKEDDRKASSSIPKKQEVAFQKDLIYLLPVLAIVFIVSMIVYWYAHNSSIDLRKSAPATVSEVAIQVPTVKPLKIRTVPAGKVEVTLETIARSWVYVSSGTKELYSQTLEPGVKLNFVGREISVKAGNGGGVRVYINGKSIGVMGESGIVAEKTYKASE